MNLEEKVQSLLTAANAATGKADTNLTDAVGSLIAGQGGGGDNALLYAKTTYHLFNGTKKYFPAEFEVTLGQYWNSGEEMFNSDETSTNCNRLIINSSGHPTTLKKFLSEARNSCPKVVKLNFDTSHVTDFSSAFYNCYRLEEIQGALDFSSATTVSSMFYTTQYVDHKLREVRFTPNTLSISMTIDAYNSVLTIDSLISIANGLNETATGKTITMSNANIDKCDATLGTVSLDETETYHIFTEDAAGTVTLTDFITTVKGWTLA